MESNSSGKQIQRLIRASKLDHSVGRGKPCFASQFAKRPSEAYERISYLDTIIEQLSNRRLL